MKELRPVFIKNKNVKRFESLMANLERDKGEGRLACVFGQAGRGKTRTAQCLHAHSSNTIFMRILTVWNSSEKAFIRALLLALDAGYVPWTTAECFEEAKKILQLKPIPIFLDEVEKLPVRFLSIIRDLSDETGAPFILIGEEPLYGFMKRERRVWSRTVEVLEFQPLTPAEVTQYALEAGNVALKPEFANEFTQAASGDFRIVCRDFAALLRLMNARKSEEITPEIVKLAIKQGLRGGMND